MTETNVYLSLGSNVGDRAKNLRAAIGHLPHAGVAVAKVSSFYETEPVNLLEQPWFLNCVVEAATHYEAAMLLRALLEIETKMGSTRASIRRNCRCPIRVCWNADSCSCRWWKSLRGGSILPGKQPPKSC